MQVQQVELSRLLIPSLRTSPAQTLSVTVGTAPLQPGAITGVTTSAGTNTGLHY